LKLEIKTILKKMEWDDDPAGGAEQIMEDLSEKVLNEFYP
jgi:Fe-S-cluster formation regulator IscX/YfhJ